MNVNIDNMGPDQDTYLLSIKKGFELWCCENTLYDKLKILFEGKEILKNKKLSFPDFNMFPDFRVPSKNLVIEFNGYRHFTVCKDAYRDILKRNILKREKINLIEIPHFVQLSLSVVQFLFKNYTNNIVDLSMGYPHGFIHPKSGCIGDYCTIGLEYVKNILKDFPFEVKEECFKSLEIRSKLDNVPINVYNPLSYLE